MLSISLLCRQCSSRGEFCPSQRSALCSAALHNSTRPRQNWHSYFSHSSYSIEGNCSSILTKTLKCIWSRIASQTAITQNLYNHSPGMHMESSQWCDGDFAAGLQYKHCMLYKCSHTFARSPLHVALYCRIINKPCFPVIKCKSRCITNVHWADWDYKTS